MGFERIKEMSENLGFQRTEVSDMKKIVIIVINLAWLLTILLGCFSMEAREAEPNPTVTNPQGDLEGSNMGDQVVLSWAFDDRATGYVLFRSTSLQGPWVERLRFDADAVRSGGSQVDITPDARLMDLCYKVDAVDGKGEVIRRYEPICVRKFVEK